MATVVVVADDLTGIADTLIQFRARCDHAIVFPSLDRFEQAIAGAELPPGDLAIGVSTESRHLSPAEAAERVSRAHRAALRLWPRLLYQKVDSALRGNPGAELAAYRRATGAAHVLMTPAFLPSERTVRDGTLYAGGLPLALSESNGDTRAAINESSAVAIIARGSDAPVSSVRLSGGTRAGDGATWPAAPPGIVVADAESEADLEDLARFAVRHGLLHAIAGSAGLAGHLATVLGEPRRQPAPAPGAGRVLLVCGSPHPVAVRQLEYARSTLSLPLRRIDGDGGGRRLALPATKILVDDLDRRGVAVISAPPLEGMSSMLDPEAVASSLAEAATGAFEGGRINAVIACGGDIAAAMCRRLNVDRIELEALVVPGAPLGRIRGGRGDAVWISTKSGAHGDDAALVTVLAALQRRPPAHSGANPSEAGERS